MLTRLYQWMLAKAAHRHADRWLAVISFMESSFFPIPPDVLLAPMCLSQPKRAFYYAFVCTAASVLGALLGYAIGYFLFDTIGQAILDFYGLGDKFSAFSDNFNEQGWLIVFLGSGAWHPQRPLERPGEALPPSRGAGIPPSRRVSITAGGDARPGATSTPGVEIRASLGNDAGATNPIP